MNYLCSKKTHVIDKTPYHLHKGEVKITCKQMHTLPYRMYEFHLGGLTVLGSSRGS